MFRRFIILGVLVLVVTACSEAADTVPTSTAPSTTAPRATDPTEAPSTTTTTETATTNTTETATTGPTGTAVDIVLTGGTVDRVERYEVPLDGAVRVTVAADISDEVHIHGYDIRAAVSPGTDAVIGFDATIPGVFEIELEGSGVLIGELQVAP
jgi:hypothetical protein